MSFFSSFATWWSSAIKPIWDQCWDMLDIEVFGMPLIYSLLMLCVIGIVVGFITRYSGPGGLSVASTEVRRQNYERRNR